MGTVTRGVIQLKTKENGVSAMGQFCMFPFRSEEFYNYQSKGVYNYSFGWFYKYQSLKVYIYFSLLLGFTHYQFPVGFIIFSWTHNGGTDRNGTRQSTEASHI